jgi:hypothetical protein
MSFLDSYFATLFNSFTHFLWCRRLVILRGIGVVGVAVVAVVDVIEVVIMEEEEGMAILEEEGDMACPITTILRLQLGFIKSYRRTRAEATSNEIVGGHATLLCLMFHFHKISLTFVFFLMFLSWYLPVTTLLLYQMDIV